MPGMTGCGERLRLPDMEDPKRQAWMYLVAGVVAIVAAIYFLSTEAPGQDKAA